MEENSGPGKAMMQIGEVDDAYFESFPAGYLFEPNKEELIGYLKAKVFNEPLPPNRIHDVLLYDHHPEELTGKPASTLFSFFFLFFSFFKFQVYIYIYTRI